MESGPCSAVAAWRKTNSLDWPTRKEPPQSEQSCRSFHLSLLTLSLNLALSPSCSPAVSDYPNILASPLLRKDWKKLMCKQYSLWPLWLGCLSQHRHVSHNIRLIEERSFFGLFSHLSFVSLIAGKPSGVLLVAVNMQLRFSREYNPLGRLQWCLSGW